MLPPLLPPASASTSGRLSAAAAGHSRSVDPTDRDATRSAGPTASLGRRLLLLAVLLVFLFVACALLYVALQTRNALWLLASLAVFAVLITAWVRTLIALRRRARRARGGDPDRSATGLR